MKPKNQTGSKRPPGDVVLRLRKQGAVASLLVGQDEKTVCAYIDGQRSVSEIIKASSLPGFVTTMVLQALMDRGIAEVPGDQEIVGAPASPRKGQTLDLSELFSQRRTLQGPVAAAERRLKESSPAPEQPEQPSTYLAPISFTEPHTPPPVHVVESARSTSGEFQVPSEPRQRRGSPYASFVYPDGGNTPAPVTPAPITPAPVTPAAALVVPDIEHPVSAVAPMDPVPPPLENAPPPETPSGLEKRIHVGPYRVVGRLAKGGVGSVYLCSRGGPFGFRRMFALKVIRQHLDQNIDAERSFAEEARIGGKLCHPNTNGVLDAGLYEQQPYLIMPYVEGLNLYQLHCTGKQNPPALIVSVICDVLRGLQYLHDLVDDDGRPMNLVHGDLSPDNILVGIDGAARLTDFGRVRSAGSVSEAASNGLVGKPGFSAPEQLQGKRIDHRTDLFTLGIVLWTSLTGKDLFAESTFEATVMNILRRPVERPSELGAPACFDGICLRALSRSPDGRFKSADEMRLALQTAAASSGLLSTAAEVAEWVRDAGGDQLSERRRLIAQDAVEAAMGGVSPDPDPQEERRPTGGGRSNTMVLPRQGGTPRMGVQVPKRTTIETALRSPNATDDTDVPARSHRSWIVTAVVGAIVFAVAAFLIGGTGIFKTALRSGTDAAGKDDERSASVGAAPGTKKESVVFDAGVDLR